MEGKNFTTFDNFDKHKSFEDNDHCIAIKETWRTDGKTFGCVVMGSADIYSDDNEKNKEIHIPISPKDAMNLLKEYLLDKFNVAPFQITCGHEHGDSKKRCHYQMCVEFAEGFRKTIKPFEIKFNDNFLLGMFQKSRNPYALKNYCKKEGDFYYLDDSKAIVPAFKKGGKEGEPKKIDPWMTLVNNKDKISKDDALDLVLSHDPRSGIMAYKNIEYAIESITKPQLPPLVWTYPKHLDGIYPAIEQWFELYCKPEGMTRRKALLLYSETRALGKTRFAQSLCNHEDYVVIFRNSFTQAAVKGKEPKLVVLDDMNFYSGDNKETWKALVAGQKTSIRDAYANFLWQNEVPCIITTNNENLVVNLAASPEFQTQIIFVQINSYMGPEGTEPKDMHMFEHSLNDEMLKKIYAKEKERELMKENKVNGNLLGNKRNPDQSVAQMQLIMQLNQRIQELESELKKKKKERD